jgi:hypothetical protein
MVVVIGPAGIIVTMVESRHGRRHLFLFVLISLHHKFNVSMSRRPSISTPPTLVPQFLQYSRR